MNQIGEMVLVRGQLAHIISDQRAREGSGNCQTRSSCASQGCNTRRRQRLLQRDSCAG